MATTKEKLASVLALRPAKDPAAVVSHAIKDLWHQDLIQLWCHDALYADFQTLAAVIYRIDVRNDGRFARGSRTAAIQAHQLIAALFDSRKLSACGHCETIYTGSDDWCSEACHNASVDETMVITRTTSGLFHALAYAAWSRHSTELTELSWVMDVNPAREVGLAAKGDRAFEVAEWHAAGARVASGVDRVLEAFAGYEAPTVCELEDAITERCAMANHYAAEGQPQEAKRCVEQARLCGAKESRISAQVWGCTLRFIGHVGRLGEDWSDFASARLERHCCRYEQLVRRDGVTSTGPLQDARLNLKRAQTRLRREENKSALAALAQAINDLAAHESIIGSRRAGVAS